VKTVSFPDGTTVPALGQGTWMMGENPTVRAQEVAALQLGLDLGMTLIDTAEMYGKGAAESLVGEAMAGRRDEVFLVSKAYPQNASSRRLPQSCEASLRRLGTDRIDLYLLHWRGGIPLVETVEAMERLVASGKIVRWGVSNLDIGDMAELIAAGGDACATDQILFNLTRRGPELDLIPWLAKRSMPVMAYSPIEQGRLLAHDGLQKLARNKGVTAAQLALAWLLAQNGVITIPKSGTPSHVRDNHASLDLALSPDDTAELELIFPRPPCAVPLDML
jgi:diketogulonate reductase-like aldo/keto reductase